MLLVKEPVRIRKARRVKPGTVVEPEPKLESVFETPARNASHSDAGGKVVKEEPVVAKEVEEVKKVDLKDIDQQLDEILG